jgi:hypothetical protein
MIPWSALLRHAPVILAAADTLLARATSSRAGGAPQGLEERLAGLERGSRESAQLLHEMAQQVQGLTVMEARTARRARAAVALGAAALAIAVGTLVFVIFWR